MAEREGYERLDLTPPLITGDELDDIRGLLESTKSGYRLAFEATTQQPERVLYVPDRDIAPSWEELVDWSAGIAANLPLQPDDVGDHIGSMAGQIDLRLYPVRLASQSDEEPPVLIVVDWTNERIVGLG